MNIIKHSLVFICLVILFFILIPSIKINTVKQDYFISENINNTVINISEWQKQLYDFLRIFEENNKQHLYCLKNKNCNNIEEVIDTNIWKFIELSQLNFSWHTKYIENWPVFEKVFSYIESIEEFYNSENNQEDFNKINALWIKYADIYLWNKNWFNASAILSAVKYLVNIDGNYYNTNYTMEEKNNIFQKYLMKDFEEAILLSVNKKSWFLYNNENIKDYFEQYYYQEWILNEKLHLTFYPVIKYYYSTQLIKNHHWTNNGFDYERDLFFQNDYK